MSADDLAPCVSRSSDIRDKIEIRCQALLQNCTHFSKTLVSVCSYQFCATGTNDLRGGEIIYLANCNMTGKPILTAV